MKNLLIFKAKIALLLVASVLLFTSCSQKNTPSYSDLSQFIGTWEYSGESWTSTYKITSSEVIDVTMDCIYSIQSDELILSADEYYYIFTKCTKGTQYTPENNFYAVVVKFMEDQLAIICPIDSQENYTSLSELQEHYTSKSTVGSEMYSLCSKVKD